MHRAALLLLVLCLPGISQNGPPGEIPQFPPLGHAPDVKLPNGKSQNDAIVKQDHERDLKDAAQLAELARTFEAELQKQDSHVLSIATLKKLDEIDKLARRIQGRMKRY